MIGSTLQIMNNTVFAGNILLQLIVGGSLIKLLKSLEHL